jgi:threonylcarbamoyladenosine tRNA methylthiotransferase MtaB
MRGAAFSHAHVFRFSVREGTAAAALADDVPAAEKARRSADISAVADQTRSAYLGLFQGREARVLVERSAGEESSGYSEYYLPVTIRQGR